MRLAHGVSGGLMALGWLVLPMEMAGVDHSVPLIPAEQFVAASTSAPGGAAPDGGGTSTGDLVLPVVAVGAAGLLAVYAQVRRRRRMRTRTTPGGTSVGAASVEEIEARARRSLVETDDSVRTSAEELRAAAAQLGDTAVRPFRAALEYAESELAAAFRLRHRLDDSVAGGGADTRGMLEEIVARCAEAGRRLDAEAAAFDQTRSLERQAPAVLERTEARFRELTVRASAADTTLAELHERYAPSAVVPVAGHVEQAKDRLVFATSSLNRARQALDRGETERAVVLLRAAEGAVDQAAAFVDGVARLAAELAAAAERLPAAVAGTETGLVAARGRTDGGAGARADLPGRIARGEAVVAEVRREMSTGVYDPVGALRRIEQAHAGVDVARHHEPDDDEALVRLDHSRLTARSATAATSDYVTTHRGAVGYEARTLLAEAIRRLHRPETGWRASDGNDVRPEPEGGGHGGDAEETPRQAEAGRAPDGSETEADEAGAGPGLGEAGAERQPGEVEASREPGTAEAERVPGTAEAAPEPGTAETARKPGAAEAAREASDAGAARGPGDGKAARHPGEGGAGPEADTIKASPGPGKTAAAQQSAGAAAARQPREGGAGPEVGEVEAGWGLVPVVGLGEVREADALARRARQVAERDVRAYGNPYGAGAPAGDGTGGAVLGGILLGGSARHDDAHHARHGPAHSGGPTSADGPAAYSGGPAAYSDRPTVYSDSPAAYSGGPASFGGPRTRGRRGGGELFRPPAAD
ncbi:hypothetical protein AQJ43_01925 [Streptomyces avermitilis]|uniref:Uncharacterized protein n=1 Tax=Streptomyces avermitilis TaxID=33903 RepID=A0A4D4LP80_STRAX|nr:hypothetical protein AQJ43_01925 [Streptomyces avermitilis]GDY63072.1 hypothetical protein SAV14893_024650 [Streptomyces avermitilis]GDY85721.1 hypothetical protein SAVCW2_49200 [Streptomyces avermitilis]